jgi:hypothetical protein
VIYNLYGRQLINNTFSESYSRLSSREIQSYDLLYDSSPLRLLLGVRRIVGGSEMEEIMHACRTKTRARVSVDAKNKAAPNRMCRLLAPF